MFSAVTRFCLYQVLVGSREQSNEYESFPSWDNGSVCGDDAGDYGGDLHSDMEDSNTLITQPRQVGFSE